MRYAMTLLLLTTMLAGFASGRSPTGWSPIVFPTGEYRDRLRVTPIDRRPGRPLHVYGNLIRLMDQMPRGSASRPVRQIILGTPRLRAEADRRR